MKRKGFVNFVYSFGEFAGWLIGAGLMIADIIKNSFDIGIIKGDAIFWIGLALVLLACFWRVFKSDKKARDAEERLDNYEKEMNNKSLLSETVIKAESEGQKGGRTIATQNYYEGDKKKEDEPEARFHRTHLHQEFHIKKDSAQNVLNFIRNDISSSLWFTGDGGKDSYHVNYQETLFLYLGKDNTPADGAFFSTVKNGKHFPNFFWISIISSGIGENTLLTVNFETQERDAVEFFSLLRKRLVKHFTIWEPRVSKIL